MAKINRFISLVTTSFTIGTTTVWAMPDVQVNGLLPNQTVVTINGQQHILKSGKTSPEGVTLVSADSKAATFEWQGQRFSRTLDREITSNFSAKSARSEVRIERGLGGHFYTSGIINGLPVHFMVDTGAWAVCMGMDEADRLKLDWRNGERFITSTAGGSSPAYRIVLSSVTVGDITLHNVTAGITVANTGTNADILLGMTFLQQTEMREDNNALVLTKKY